MSLATTSRFTAAAVALTFLVAAGQSFISNLAVARADASSARAATAQALKGASDAAATAAFFRSQAATFDAQRIAAVARADSVAQTARRLRTSFSAAAVPDTCRALVILADSTLAAQDTEIASLRAGLQASQDARSSIQVALDTTTTALTALRASSAKLVTADAQLAKRSQPSLLARLMPHPGVGIAAGFDPAGTPRVITGITLSWSF